MKVYTYNETPSFGLIKLLPADLDKSENLLRNIAKHSTNIEKRNGFALDLYKIFTPYIQEEAKLRAKTSYIFEEIFSEIKVKFWEFIHEIKNKDIIDDLIEKINEDIPNSAISRLKYNERSLDDFIPNTRKTYAEGITSDNLPVSQSQVEIDEIKDKLNDEINNTKMTKSTKRRIIHRSRGLKYSDIAKKEGVGVSTVRKSVNRGILQIQTQNNAVSEEYHQRISNLANLIGTTFEEMLKFTTKHIQILSSSMETINRNIETFSKKFKISKSEFVKIAMKQPTLFYQKPQTIYDNIDASAEILGISKEKFITIALKRPKLFCQNSETIKNKVDNFTKTFNISKKEFIKLALRMPQILSQKTETLNNNIKTSAELLEISETSFVKAALQQPALFYQKPKTINNNIEKTAKAFNISKEEYVKAALMKPQLFSYSTNTLKKKINAVTKKLRVSKEDYIKIALKRPQLLNMKTETINSNVEMTAKLLGIKKSDFVKAALKQSQLFYQKPETINSNVENSAEILGITKSAFVKMALIQPALFYQKPETLSRKLKIANYYKTLVQEPVTNISGRRISTSDEELYKDILVCIVKNKRFSTLNKADIKTNLAELLKTCQDTITVEIPNFEYAEDFIKFAENYSIKSTGNNIFKIIVKE